MQFALPAGWSVTTSLPTYQLAATYNDASQVTTTTATAGTATYSFSPVYDSSNGSLQGLSSGTSGSTANLATLAYNEYAQLSTLTLLNGSSTQIASMQYSYDGNQRPSSLTTNWLPGSGNSGQILGKSLTYDNASNVSSSNTFFAAVPGQSGSGGTEVQNFCYDEQNRLVWSGNGGTQPGAGNGTCGSGALSSGLTGGGYTAPYVYTNLGQIWQGPLNGTGTNRQYLYCSSSHPHQLTGIYPTGTTCAGLTGAVYTASFDAWGNETSRTSNSVTATLSYDALNHLVKYSAGSNQELYFYDAGGNRVLKRSVTGSGTTLTVSAYGLQELSYTGAGAFSSQIDYYSVAGHLIGSTNGSTTTYDLTDAQGSVLTTLSASAVLGEQTYGPYGNQRYLQGTMGTSKGYTGQFTDAVTGLDYYNARYYDPVAGQFLSADTVQGNAQGMSPYSYVEGNPESRTDPTGQRFCPTEGSCGGDSGGGGAQPPPPTKPKPTPPSNPCELSGGNPQYCQTQPPPTGGCHGGTTKMGASCPTRGKPTKPTKPTKSQIDTAKDDAGLASGIFAGIGIALGVLALSAEKLAAALGQLALDLAATAAGLEASVLGVVAGIALMVIAVAVGLVAAIFATIAASAGAYALIAGGVAAAFQIKASQHDTDVSNWDSAAIDGFQSRMDAAIGGAGVIATILSAARVAAGVLSGPAQAVVPAEDLNLDDAVMTTITGLSGTGSMIALANSQIDVMRSDLGE